MTTDDEARKGPLTPAADADTVVIENPPAAAMHMSPDEADLSAIRLLEAAASARENQGEGKEKMSDDKTSTGNPDRQRISLSEDYEVRDWAKTLGVTEQALRDAVGRVGDQVDDVKRELGGRR